MSSLIKFTALVVLIAVVTHVLTVALVPTLIMQRVMSTMAQQEQGEETTDEVGLRRGVNVALPAPLPDARNQRVVRPSPDLLYTACVYDVSDQPLHVFGPVQDSYVSLSGFAANTDNFFVINDRQINAALDGEKRFDVVIRGSASGFKPLPAGARVIDAPTDRGILLFRSLVPSEKALESIYQFQSQQQCVPLQ